MDGQTSKMINIIPHIKAKITEQNEWVTGSHTGSQTCGQMEKESNILKKQHNNEWTTEW